MKVPYDKHYQQKEYFGNPLPGLLRFFENYESRGMVLDLGCGQGRDSLALASMGFNVIGVDISEVGLLQLQTKAKKLSLDIQTVKADIYTYPVKNVDIVIMDSMLHFYKQDLEKETQLVKRLVGELKPGGILCNCMQAGKTREKLYKKILVDSIDFKTLLDEYSEYPDFGADYHIHIIQKSGDAK